MNNPGILLLLLLLAGITIPASGFAECLILSDKTLDEKRADYGMVTAEWSAKIRNQCDASYDGTLKVNLLDKDEKVLQAVTDIVILQANEEKESRRTVTIPAESVDEVKRIDVEIRERARPR